MAARWRGFAWPMLHQYQDVPASRLIALVPAILRCVHSAGPMRYPEV